MIATEDLIRWLKTLPPDSGVGVDDGGLTLRCDKDIDAYYEVGGMPDPPQCIPVRCGICEWQGPESAMKCDLNGIPDLFSRIEVGGEVPAGECPECGGLCYLVKEDK